MFGWTKKVSGLFDRFRQTVDWEHLFIRRSGWLALLILAGYGLYALFFVPMHHVLQGAEGIIQGLLVMTAGLLLGSWRGFIMGAFIGGSSGWLWGMFYPQSVLVFTLSALISGVSAMAFGLVGDFFRRARQQSVELRVANEALMAAEVSLRESEKLAFLGQLAANVSHEINQPLTIINMAAEMALIRLPKDSDPALLANLQRIIGQSQRAGKIIQHLKMLGREDHSDHYIPRDLNTVVENAIALLSEQLRLNNIQLEVSLLPGTSPVRCDPVQLEMALSNLLINARDALTDVSTKKIGVTTRRVEDRIEVEISDCGCGIPPEQLERIFHPFFTTKEVGKGTGLGLSISHRIAQAHRGTLSVQSQVGKGTRFFLTLPEYRMTGNAGAISA